MKNLGIPLLLLGALLSLWAIITVFSGSGPKVDPSARSTREKMRLAVQKAENFLKNSSFAEAYVTIEPYKNSSEGEIQFLLGKILMGLRDWSKAAQAFERAVSQSSDPEIKLYLGRAYEVSGDRKKAVDTFTLIKDAGISSQARIETLFALARLSLSLNKTDDAEEFYRSIVKEDPKRLEAFVEIFRLFRKGKKMAEGEKLQAIGEKYHSERFSFNFELGLLFWESGEKEKARSFFERCIQLKPQPILPHYYLYELCKSEQKTPEALLHLEKIFSSNQRIPLNVNHPEIFFEAAIQARDEERLDLTFKFLREAFLSDRSLLGRDDKNAIKAVQGFISRKGSPEEKIFMNIFTDFINGEFQKARKNMEGRAATFKDKRLASDARKLIAACDELNAREEAYNSYAARIKAEKETISRIKKTPPVEPGPPKPETGSQASSVAKIPEDPRIQEIKLLAAANSDDPEVQYDSALQLAKLDDPTGAKKLFQEALRLKPGFSEVHHSLALICLTENQKGEAIEHLQTEILINPKSSFGYSLLAGLVFEDNDFQRAIDLSRKALEINPKNAEAHLALARAYHKITLRDAALEEIDKGLLSENDSTTENSQALVALRKQIKDGD